MYVYVKSNRKEIEDVAQRRAVACMLGGKKSNPIESFFFYRLGSSEKNGTDWRDYVLCCYPAISTIWFLYFYVHSILLDLGGKEHNRKSWSKCMTFITKEWRHCARQKDEIQDILLCFKLFGHRIILLTFQQRKVVFDGSWIAGKRGDFFLVFDWVAILRNFNLLKKKILEGPQS